MTITETQAIPTRGMGNPVLIVAAIRNDTGRDDELVGGSSPVASVVRLYGRIGETPGPTDPVTGIPNLEPIASLSIGANETVRFLPGYGGMILSGLSQPLVAGQTVEVTFLFAHADPVTVQIPVVSPGV